MNVFYPQATTLAVSTTTFCNCLDIPSGEKICKHSPKQNCEKIFFHFSAFLLTSMHFYAFMWLRSQGKFSCWHCEGKASLCKSNKHLKGNEATSPFDTSSGNAARNLRRKWSRPFDWSRVLCWTIVLWKSMTNFKQTEQNIWMSNEFLEKVCTNSEQGRTGVATNYFLLARNAGHFSLCKFICLFVCLFLLCVFFLFMFFVFEARNLGLDASRKDSDTSAELVSAFREEGDGSQIAIRSTICINHGDPLIATCNETMSCHNWRTVEDGMHEVIVSGWAFRDSFHRVGLGSFKSGTGCPNMSVLVCSNGRLPVWVDASGFVDFRHRLRFLKVSGGFILPAKAKMFSTGDYRKIWKATIFFPLWWCVIRSFCLKLT